MVKWVAHFVVHCEFGNHEPSKRFIANDMGVERHGEHIIQPSANKVGRGLHCWHSCLVGTLALLALLPVAALVVKGAIQMWLLQLADLDMPLGVFDMHGFTSMPSV